MNLHDFIFTKKPPAKYYRHITFWTAQFLFWVFWIGGFFYSFNKGYFEHQLKLRGYFILDVVYTYSIAYYLMPKYPVAKSFLKFGVLLIILSLATYILFIFSLFWNLNLMNSSRDAQLLNAWFFSMNFIINGPPIVCAMFLTCKMLKNYYLKMEEKLTLTKENANAELQLLKAQVHPHFLFNTLNNIYSFILTKSSKAEGLVLKLSDTIRYMVNDCEAASVPLEKELKMLEDYMDLEKVRYGDRLNMLVEINGEYKNKMIAPLLMIPFVENCFKNGVSVMRGQQWIKLNININEDQLDFKLSNSKPPGITGNTNKKGIGLVNVQKRLQLLYPDKHSLIIDSANDSYFVELKINLQQLSILGHPYKILPKFQHA